MEKRILIISNVTRGLYNFRRELLTELAKSYDIIVTAQNTGFLTELRSMGCRVIETPMERHGTNPVQEMRLLAHYRSLIRRLRPSMVLTYTIKPNIYGGMACQMEKIPYICNITGLGTAIENPGGLQKLLLPLYRIGIRGARKVFFQNLTNAELLLRKGAVSGPYGLLPGSGINLKSNIFEPYPSSDEPTVFLTIGRIMRDKGTDELLAAARIIKQKYPDAVFRLIGSYDGDFRAKVDAAVAEGIVEYLGYRDDVHVLIRESHATIHPSYHEGMSNVLLETAAAGRAVLASNVPGCRETFDEGISGLGFRPKDVDDLVRTIEIFLSLPCEKKAAMGAAGRLKMEREFDRRIVTETYLKEIKEIMEDDVGKPV